MIERVVRSFRKRRETILFCGHIAVLAALPCCAVIAYAIDRHRVEATGIIDTITTGSTTAKEAVLSAVSRWELRETPPAQ
jgi:hypothetical protein